MGKWVINCPKKNIPKNLSSKILIGPPKGTSKYSAEQLALMGYVGLYREDDTDFDRTSDNDSNQ